ncbi:putative ribonuclease H-like domain-containing protein [Tanacetum coccineum]|uniref:Ribonuclease H-like domain-containing protein n=1 Tax=Tanacetum coccineum TaxID=301880 RepID=A0ABQ5CF16_9ASTR
MDRNNVRPIPVAINTKFLNCLQPEWSKYVTMVHQNQSDKVISYDMLYDLLVQFEPHVLASRAKKATKNHDPLALIAHSNAFSSHRHANSSYSPQSYYVTHPPSVCYNCNEKGHYAHDSQKPKVRDAKYFREQMLLAMKDEVETAETTDTVPSYDDKAVSQVHDSSKAHEQVSQVTRKTIIQTTDDDQIDSSIIFDGTYVNNKGGTSTHDLIAHEENNEIQMLSYNVQREAEKQKRVNNELKKQKDLVQQELETFLVKTFETQAVL